ncbi:MAG: DUF2497 domain-containing protein [Alphaproteobacteria bacterium]|jgi:cell pole-organizing protein PopZ|nr:DUF2497 domain-containing protein [Alphaproteobacteria bacterium]
MAGQHADSQKSMEDILSSIRETIEEDMKAGKNWTETTLGKVIASAAPSGEKAEVFELTQMVNEDGSVTDLSMSTNANNPFDFDDSKAQRQQDSSTTSEDLDFSDPRSLAPSSDVSQIFTSASEKASTAFEEQANETASFEEASPTTNERVEDLFDLANVSQDAGDSDGPTERAQDAPRIDAHFFEEPSRPQDVNHSIGDAEPRESSMSSYDEDQDFLSPEALSASTQALSELTQTVGQQGRTKKADPRPEGVGAQTLDEIMQDLLRPMLKEWLDARLPSLVKWIVTEQIEKIIQQSQEPQRGK